MKNRLLLFAALAALALTACSEGPADEPAQTPSVPATEPVYITASIQSDDPAATTPATRIGADDDGVSNIKLTWQEGDVLRVVNSLGASATAWKFTAIRIGDGGKTAVFESPAGYTGTPALAMWLGDWSGSTYNSDGINPRLEICTADQLMQKFWLYAPYRDAETNFVFRPLLPLMRFDLTLPAGETAIRSLRLMVQDGTPALYSTVSYNLTGGTPVLTAGTQTALFYSDALDVPLTDGRAVLYLPIAATAELAGKKLDIVVNKKYYTTQTCGTLAAGKVAPIRKTAEKWSDAVYTGGVGTEAAPYLISNETNLRALAAATNAGNTYEGKTFRLENDFSISAPESDPWIPVGYDAVKNSPVFKGNVDGNGKTIDGGTFYLSPSLVSFAGLFGQISGNVSDLTFRADIVDTNTAVSVFGAVVGGQFSETSRITNCHHIGTIRIVRTATNMSGCGGLVGRVDGVLENCSHTGDIETDNVTYIGGINATSNGTLHLGTVSDCTIRATYAGDATIGALSGLGNPYSCSTFTNVTLYRNGVESPITATGSGSVEQCTEH